MASSWLIMTAAISFSYASPLDHMHPLRPLRSLFHPAIIVSTLGQALIHIACMTLAVQWATEAMGPEALKEVRLIDREGFNTFHVPFFLSFYIIFVSNSSLSVVPSYFIFYVQSSYFYYYC